MRLCEEVPAGYRPRPCTPNHDRICQAVYANADKVLQSLSPTTPLVRLYREMEHRTPVGERSSFVDVLLIGQCVNDLHHRMEKEAQRTDEGAEHDHHCADTLRHLLHPSHQWRIFAIEVKTKRETFGALTRQMKLARAHWNPEATLDLRGSPYSVRWVLATPYRSLNAIEQDSLTADGFLYLPLIRPLDAPSPSRLTH